MSQVKRVAAGREYHYHYKMIYLTDETHLKLKKLSNKEGKSFDKLIDLLMKNYESNI
jgi:hypothetical protein